MKDAPIRHALEYLPFVALRTLLRRLPHPASRAIGGALGALAGRLDRRHLRVAEENLAAAFPTRGAPERATIARGCFRHFGRLFADALSAGRFDAVELCRRVTATGLEHLVAAEAAGKGVLVLSAHWGDWEIVPPFVAVAVGPMASVGRPADNPHVDRELQRLRTRFGNLSLDKRGAVRGMLRLLAGRGRLGLLVDQRVRASEGIEVEFFGRPAWTSPIVARLAARTGAPVVAAFGDLAPGGRYRIDFLPPLHPTAAEAEDDGRAFTRRCLALCEERIATAPERWLWLHERWKR